MNQPSMHDNTRVRYVDSFLCHYYNISRDTYYSINFKAYKQGFIPMLKFHMILFKSILIHSRWDEEGCGATIQEGAIDHLQDEGEVHEGQEGYGGTNGEQHTWISNIKITHMHIGR